MSNLKNICQSNLQNRPSQRSENDRKMLTKPPTNLYLYHPMSQSKIEQIDPWHSAEDRGRRAILLPFTSLSTVSTPVPFNWPKRTAKKYHVGCMTKHRLGEKYVILKKTPSNIGFWRCCKKGQPLFQHRSTWRSRISARLPRPVKAIRKMSWTTSAVINKKSIPVVGS